MGRKKTPLGQVEKISLRRIAFDPENYPKPHGEDEIEDLVQSLMSKGLQTPILVHRAGGAASVRLVVGGRRLLAAKRLGWREIDCLVLDGAFGHEVAVIEELQRGRFDPWELAGVLHDLKGRMGWTQGHLGMALGRNRDFVANALAIAQIIPEAKALIQGHEHGARLTARHLRYVARGSPGSQMEFAARLLAGPPSTTELQQEKKVSAPSLAEEKFFRVRPLRKRGTPLFPKTAKEWRKYSRQLHTDLKAVTRREKAETRRARELIAEAVLRQRLLKKAATKMRRELGRELKQALKQLARLGEL